MRKKNKKSKIGYKAEVITLDNVKVKMINIDEGIGKILPSKKRIIHETIMTFYSLKNFLLIKR